jgi:hypothetical protein
LAIGNSPVAAGKEARPTAALTPSLRRRVFLFALTLILVLVALQYFFKARDDRSAFLRWRPQILEIFTTDIYQRYAYPNPPIMALLLWPLAQLPPLAGSFGWFSLKIVFAVLALHWIFHIVAANNVSFPGWARAVVVVLGLRPVMGDLSHGNVNLWILFLVVAALYAFHERQDFVAGIVMALAIACKVTPALFLPYFLWKRAWTMLIGMGIGLILWLVLVPGMFLGMQRNLQLFGSWYSSMVRPFVERGEVTTDHVNQSLPGLAYRLLTHRPSAYVKGTPVEYENVADVDPRYVRTGLQAAMAAFAVLVVLVCRAPIASRANWQLAAEYSIVVLGMLAFSERTWKHHCVTLLLPFAVLTYAACAVPLGRYWRGYLAATLVLVGLFMAATAGGLTDSWNQVAKMAEVAGTYVWAYFLLLIGLVVLLRKVQAEPPPSVHLARAA